MMRKILVVGLPEAGKTAHARILARRLNGVLFNADQLRANINKDLGFSPEGRIEQTRRMGRLCDGRRRRLRDRQFPQCDAGDAHDSPRWWWAFIMWLSRVPEGRFASSIRQLTPGVLRLEATPGGGTLLRRYQAFDEGYRTNSLKTLCANLNR